MADDHGPDHSDHNPVPDVPGSSRGPQPSIGIVINWCRRRLTADRFANRSGVVVPAELAHWVVAGPGEPADRKGLRPLGAVVERLLDLVDAAGLTPQERAVLGARAGLTEYPARRPARPLGLRVPTQRRRRSGDGVCSRRLRDVYEQAVAKLDRHLATHPRPDRAGSTPRPDARPVPAGLVPDPALDPWFTGLVDAPDQQRRLLLRAVESARAFVAASGLSRHLDGPLGELDAYEQSLVTGPGWPRTCSVGRSRAHALVGVALWGLLSDRRRDVGVEAATRSGRWQVPAGFRPATASAALGRLLAGEVDEETAVAACDDTLRCERVDHASAVIMADLLLGCYAQHHERLGDDAGASLLRTVVRVRSIDEDPTSLSLLRLLVERHPRTWQAVDAAQQAVPVAAGHQMHRRAEEIHRWVERTLQGAFRLLPGRVRRVEVAEFRLWNLYQRLGAYERRLDLGEPSRPLLTDALRLAGRLEARLDQVLVLNQTEGPGDAVPEWRFHVKLRAAELRLIALHRHGDQAPAACRHAVEDVRAAEGVLVDCGLTGHTVHRVRLLTAKLRAALVLGKHEAACQLAQAIARAGWPIARTPLFAHGFGLRRPDDLPPPVREAALALLREQAGAATIVDGSTRRRQLAA
ncbi:MAG TPA: hypothetical protein VIL36_24695 [Acidimicrobiales bacterium]